MAAVVVSGVPGWPNGAMFPILNLGGPIRVSSQPAAVEEKKKPDRRSDLSFLSPFIYPTHLVDPRQSKTDRVVVLDLDETLVHSFHLEAELNAINRYNIWASSNHPELRLIVKKLNIDNPGPPGEGTRIKVYMVYRPGLKRFLSRLTYWASAIIVLTAGKASYAFKAYQQIWSDLPKPRALLTADVCDKEIIEVPGYPRQLRLFKRLEKVYGMYPEARPDNTILIDNADYNTKPNPKNSILIPDYQPDPTIESILTPDDCLNKIMDFFEAPGSEVAHGDVRKVDLTQIFGNGN